MKGDTDLHLFDSSNFTHHLHILKFVPTTVTTPLAEDGLLLDTLHSYSPTSLPVTVSVWVYVAVVVLVI